jgi:hypothetical protein
MQVQVMVGGKHHVPAALSPGKGPGTLCSGGWVCLRDDLEGYGEKNLLQQGCENLMFIGPCIIAIVEE